MSKHYIVVTLFPELFPGPLGVGVTGRGLEQGLFQLETISIRDYGIGKHRVVDDTPYGGGSGMVMKPEPVLDAIEAAKARAPQDAPVLLMSPQGPPLTQNLVRKFVRHDGLILVCGRYEGIDERVMSSIDEVVSIGDYILSGGEMAATIILDATLRLVPGVLGNPDSLDEESFGSQEQKYTLLEYPQYTRPRVFRDEEVPPILLSGHHEAIRKWRLEQSLRRTLAARPDLLERRNLSPEERQLLNAIQKE